MEEESGGEVQGGAGGESGAVANWRDSLSEDIRDNESLSKFTDIGALAKSYINAEQMIGKDKIVIPSTEDEWSNAYQKLGRPDSPDGYEIGKVEGLEVNDDAMGFFKGLFHQTGLNQS